MALTTRNVIFVLRAQDFASHEIKGVSRAFSRLSRQARKGR